MADRLYRLHDIKAVPRGEKAAYIWQYYKIHIVVAVALLLFFGTLAYNGLIRQRTDVYLLWCAPSYNYETMENVRLYINQPEFDLDGSGKAIGELAYSAYSNTDYRDFIQLQTLINSGTYYILLITPEVYQRLANDDLLAKNGDISWYETDSPDEIFCLNAWEIPSLKSCGVDEQSELMLCLRWAPTEQYEKKKDIKNYNQQLSALREILG